MSTGWTTAAELTGLLQRRWKQGRWATARARGEVFVPVSLPVRAPTGADVLERLDEVRRWADRFTGDSRDRRGRPRWRIEMAPVRGRHVGTNQLPARVWLDSLEQLCEAIGALGALEALDEVVAVTAADLPAASGWLATRPLRGVEHRDVWVRLVAIVRWIERHPTDGVYLRQLDVEGVDTKFVERHGKILDELLTAVLPACRTDPEAPAGDLVRRYRFRPKPTYVRLRLLSPQPSLPSGVSELRLRSDELTASGIEASTVYIVENEITYLAFPASVDAVVMWGSGYGLEAANAGAWLEGRHLVYWGDIDTHGLAILDRLRARHPVVTSMLMDTETLLAHPAQWSEEAAPVIRPLPHLIGSEAVLYADLVEGRYGTHVRLEQERVRYSLIEEALWR